METCDRCGEPAGRYKVSEYPNNKFCCSCAEAVRCGARPQHQYESRPWNFSPDYSHLRPDIRSNRRF